MSYRILLALFCPLALSAVPVTAPAQPVIPAPPPITVLGPGHTAHWFDPERSGEGWVLEILDEARAVVYWFTFDEAGDQRWLIGVGDIVSDTGGQRIEFPELIVTRGGEFGPGFDPDQVVREIAGQATMAFTDCDRGLVSYQAFGQEQTIELTRLSRTMAADCTEPIHGRALMPITEDAGLSGSWFDRQRSGEGFSLQWLDRDEALITWYTYDLEGNQQWMIGVGERQGNQVFFPELVTARGARFGAAFDPGDVEIEPWGELALELDCGAGAAAWSALAAEFGEGELDLTRLTALQRPDCPFTRPKLADLYKFELTEIPVTVPSGPTNNRATAMALDGTVVGYRPGGPDGNRVWRWQPGETAVEDIPETTRFDVTLVTPDANFIVATRRDPPDAEPSESIHVPSAWSDENGWQQLPETSMFSSLVRAMSPDGTHLTGRGHPESLQDQPTAWVWDVDNGQRALLLAEGVNTGQGLGVSNDGRVVVGVQTDTQGPSFFTRRDLATRWVDGGEPEFLSDGFGARLGWAFGCNADCSIILGGNQGADVPDGHPHLQQAWFWTEQGGAEYLGELPDAVNWPYFALAAAADGSLMVGTYRVANSDGTGGTRGFVWTRTTGILAISEILEEFDISDSMWSGMLPAAVSPDGERILVRAQRSHNSESWAAIIDLTPKRQPHE